MADDITLDQAMQTVFSEFGVPDIDPDEFTAAQYSSKYDLPTQTAAHHLAAAVKAGRLIARDVLCNGRRCKGYRVVIVDTV